MMLNLISPVLPPKPCETFRHWNLDCTVRDRTKTTKWTIKLFWRHNSRETEFSPRSRPLQYVHCATRKQIQKPMSDKIFLIKNYLVRAINPPEVTTALSSFLQNSFASSLILCKTSVIHHHFSPMLYRSRAINNSLHHKETPSHQSKGHGTTNRRGLSYHHLSHSFPSPSTSSCATDRLITWNWSTVNQ